MGRWTHNLLNFQQQFKFPKSPKVHNPANQKMCGKILQKRRHHRVPQDIHTINQYIDMYILPTTTSLYNNR